MKKVFRHLFTVAVAVCMAQAVSAETGVRTDCQGVSADKGVARSNHRTGKQFTPGMMPDLAVLG